MFLINLVTSTAAEYTYYSFAPLQVNLRTLIVDYVTCPGMWKGDVLSLLLLDSCVLILIIISLSDSESLYIIYYNT